MINVRYLSGRGISLGNVPAYQRLIMQSPGARLPQVDVRQLDAQVFAQPPNLPPGTTVLPNPAAGQPPLGGGDTQTAFFVLENEAAGADDPTAGQQNYETFVGPPYEAHPTPETIEYIDPSTAQQGSFWRTWGPPLALAGGIGLAVLILRRPRRSR